MSKHVDDLKFAGTPEAEKKVMDHIQRTFGPLRIVKHKFTNCGVRHIQDEISKIITLDQRSGAAPSPKEPLKTLAEMDTQPGWKGAYFGQNAIIEDGVGAVLRVGDHLEASQRPVTL